MLRPAKTKDMKLMLSTLWIFVTLNYLYCDVVALMNPVILNQILTGNVGSIHLTENFLLGAAMLMEIPIIMVLLSRILKHKANRWANIIAGSVKTVVMITTMFIGTPALYYMFFGTIEIATTLFIVWLAYTWTVGEDNTVRRQTIGTT